jgi:hypothetical protein
MSKRRDTCTGKKCPFWKRYGDQCPNYVEGIWLTPDKHEYETKDCAPKRTMILSQQLYDFMVATRKDYAETRRATVEILKVAAGNTGMELIEAEFEDQNLIEDKSDHGKDTDK